MYMTLQQIPVTTVSIAPLSSDVIHSSNSIKDNFKPS